MRMSCQSINHLIFFRFKEEVAKALENFEEKEDVHIKEVNRRHGVYEPDMQFFLSVHGSVFISLFNFAFLLICSKQPSFELRNNSALRFFIRSLRFVFPGFSNSIHIIRVSCFHISHLIHVCN